MPQYCSGGAEDQDFGQRRRMHSSAAGRVNVIDLLNDRQWAAPLKLCTTSSFSDILR